MTEYLEKLKYNNDLRSEINDASEWIRKAKTAQKIKIKYDPDCHEIIGKCKSSKEECKNCLAITGGDKYRSCRWAFKNYP